MGAATGGVAVAAAGAVGASATTSAVVGGGVSGVAGGQAARAAGNVYDGVAVGEGLFDGSDMLLDGAAGAFFGLVFAPKAVTPLDDVIRPRPTANIATNTAGRGGAGPVRVGQEGLDYLGVTQNTTRIPRPTGTGYRVPDILDEAGGVIGEVKNVQSLSYTQQLRDYVWYAEQNSLQFDLYVRGSTQPSGPLQTAVDDGLINLIRVLP